MTTKDSGLLPFRPEIEVGSVRAETIPFEDADGVLEVLSSSTAREVFASLYRDPAPASAVAEALDLTIQTAVYHLDRLESAGLVSVVGTWYSEKGREMNVFAPTTEPLVIVAGRPSEISDVAKIVRDTGGMSDAAG